MLRRIFILGLVLALAGCSAANLNTAPQMRGIDYARDDVASLLIAFDLPRGIAPVPDASTLSFDAVMQAEGERHVMAVLVQADAGDVAGNLVPPGQGRAYYFFAFSEADRPAIREVQALARMLPPSGPGNIVSLSLLPALCANGPVDLSATTMSVLVAAPGSTRLVPLIDRQSLADLLARTGDTTLPACG